jgi:hypothetical protein
MQATVRKLETRPDDEVFDRARHQHLARVRKGGNSGADVHGVSADVAVAKFDLACMQASPHFEPDGSQPIADGARAVDCPGRSVKGCQHAVPCAPDQSSSKLVYLTPNDAVVGVEETSPLMVAHPGGQLGGTNDVGEENSRQDPVELMWGADPGQKLLDFAEQIIRIAYKGQGVGSRQFNLASVRNALSQEPPVSNPNMLGVPALHHERRDLNAGQDFRDIGLCEQPDKSRAGPRR